MSEQTPRPTTPPVRTSTKTFQPGERRAPSVQASRVDTPTQQQPAQQPAAVPPAGGRSQPQQVHPQQPSRGGQQYGAQQGDSSAMSGRSAEAAGASESKTDSGPRRIRLAISRVDPWSVMKLSFLLSIAIGIGIVVATAVVWGVLNSMGVFSQVQGLIDEVGAMAQFGGLLQYVEFSRVISVATVIAIVDVILLTALATLGAFIYNLVAAMVGGLHLTLTDD